MKKLALLLTLVALVFVVSAVAMPPPSTTNNTMDFETAITNGNAPAPAYMAIGPVITVDTAPYQEQTTQGQPAAMITKPFLFTEPEALRIWRTTSLYTGKIQMFSSIIAFSTMRERRTRTC